MLFKECVTLAVQHELTQGAINVAVRKVRGRVGTKDIDTHYDARFAMLFEGFAEKIGAISMAPIRDDLSCVGAREDWRRFFADDTAKRLRGRFGRSMAECFPLLAAANPDMGLDGFVHMAARQICRATSDAAPAPGYMRDALWGIVNVTAQVSRCVAGDLDPMILVDPSNFAPLRRPPVILARPGPQPIDCN